MATTTYDAFNAFKSKLVLTDAQSATVLNRATSAIAYAKQAFPLDCQAPLSSGKMIGSASRKTLIRPITDVDVLLQFQNKDGVFEKYRSDSRQFIYWVRDRLKEIARVEIVGTRGQAVRFFYKDGIHADLAPTFKWSEGGFGLPNGQGGWITTDPDAQAEYFEKRETELGSNLKPVVRILKRWNEAHSHHLNSFHLEVLANEAFGTLGRDSRKACEVFFNWAPEHLRVEDPAGHSPDLSTYLGQQKRWDATAALRAAKERATKANHAELAGNHREAIRLWRIVFGAEFPAYG